MYALYIPWVICDPEVNFGVMPVKGHKSRPVTPKTCSLDAKLFLVIEKRSVFDQVLSISKKEKGGTRMTQTCLLRVNIIHKNVSRWSFSYYNINDAGANRSMRKRFVI